MDIPSPPPPPQRKIYIAPILSVPYRQFKSDMIKFKHPFFRKGPRAKCENYNFSIKKARIQRKTTLLNHTLTICVIETNVDMFYLLCYTYFYEIHHERLYLRIGHFGVNHQHLYIFRICYQIYSELFGTETCTVIAVTLLPAS